MSSPLPPHVVEEPYPGGVQPHAQPERIGAQAVLLGMDPASPRRCRMLELACGEGVNVIAAALANPASEFVGVDVAPRAIAAARDTAAQVGVANARFLLCDVAALPDDLGRFDYVTAPGVYSWIPAASRDALLAACARHLAPNGVAHVSYDTLPGSFVPAMLRAMLLFHTRGAETPASRGRRGIELLDLLLAAPTGREPIFGVLRAEYRRLLDAGAVSLSHDELAPEFEPVFFADFVDHARQSGLELLGDSMPQLSAEHDLPDDIRARLGDLAPDPVSRAQYVDLIRVRRFRHTLLRLPETVPAPREPRDAFARLFVGPGIRAGDERELPAQGKAAAPPAPSAEEAADVRVVAEAMALLGESWPHRTAFADLASEAMRRAGRPAADRDAAETVLAEALLDAHELGLLTVHLDPFPCARAPGARPEASPLARLQATRRDFVASLFQENAKLHDTTSRTILALLDGTRDRAELLRLLRADAPPVPEIGPLDVPVDEALLERVLTGFAQAGLVLA